MNQSVIVFSNSTARSAAITSPIEGMITYLEDTASYESYDGAAWTSLVSASSGNIIINGAFEINQRAYVSGANLASGAYGFDRWKSTFTNTTLAFTAAPQGQEVTINSGGSIEQVIEQANIPAGTYTLSWTGTATGRVYNTGATPPSYAASPITVTLDGLANVEVEFTATGATKTLSKVQLEPGSAASQFRRNANTAEGEQSACERYFEIGEFSWTGAITNGQNLFSGSGFRTTKRGAPTMSYTTNNSSGFSAAPSANASNTFGYVAQLSPTSTSSNGYIYFRYTANSEL
jgi:hypothetical protein